MLQLEEAVDAYNNVVVSLRVACTAWGGGGTQNSTSSEIHAFTPTHRPPEAYSSMMTAKVNGNISALVAGRANEIHPGDAITRASLHAIGTACDWHCMRHSRARRSSRYPTSVKNNCRDLWHHVAIPQWCGESHEAATLCAQLSNGHKAVATDAESLHGAQNRVVTACWP